MDSSVDWATLGLCLDVIGFAVLTQPIWNATPKTGQTTMDRLIFGVPGDIQPFYKPTAFPLDSQIPAALVLVGFAFQTLGQIG